MDFLLEKNEKKENKKNRDIAPIAITVVNATRKFVNTNVKVTPKDIDLDAFIEFCNNNATAIYQSLYTEDFKKRNSSAKEVQ